VRYIEAMPAHRGNVTVTRTIAVSDMFSTGTFWAPLRCRWAQELVEEMARLPCESNDMHDPAVWGLLRMRRGGFSYGHRRGGDEYTLAPVREYY
jgi:hypothetical protein